MERIKNEILGPAYAVRLGDLGQYHRLVARCFKCGRESVIDPPVLRARFSEHERVVDLAEKLRCSECGNRTNNVLKVGKLARD